MTERNATELLRDGLRTAFIDRTCHSNLAYRPQFIYNDSRKGQKVFSTLEDELLHSDSFAISVAFITRGGITPLLQTLKELERRGVPGRILTTDYLNFSDPSALDTLTGLSNIELRMYQTEHAGNGFHTKGYIFQKSGEYRFIIGSSNLTQDALTRNMEWNTRLVSTEQGEMAGAVLDEFEPKLRNRTCFFRETNLYYGCSIYQTITVIPFHFPCFISPLLHGCLLLQLYMESLKNHLSFSELC